jgi:Transglutaminase-like superfamily
MTACILSADATDPWRLSRHVHICKLGTRFIVLNVARDEYLSVEGAAAECLSEWLSGRPRSKSEGTGSLHTRDAINQLISLGVLTINQADAQEVPHISHGPSPASQAMINNTPRTLHLRAGHILIFLRSLLSTACDLRFRSLQSTLNSLTSRKSQSAHEPEFDVEHASDLVAIFRRLRSFTFSGHRRCLFHAMVLMRFLSHYGIQPNFVMGVKIEPWAAHSWVEYGDYILDGTPEQARFYHRILIL